MDKKVLRKAYVKTMSHYSPYLTHAVTLTFKAKALIKPQVFNKCSEYKEWRFLNEEIAEASIRYFYARLSYIAFGKNSKKNSTKAHSKPLMIASIEQGHIKKRLHAHLVIGNLPRDIDICNSIQRAWFDCDFAYKQINIKPLFNAEGWLTYISKEVDIGNIDALRVQSICEPQSYLNALA